MSARAVKYWKSACALFWALVISLAADAQIYSPIVNGGSGFIINSGGNGTWTSGQLRGPDGISCTAPTYSYASSATSGHTLSGGGIDTCVGNTRSLAVLATAVFTRGTLTLGDGAFANATNVISDAANTWAQKNGTNAQVSRLYFTTTGPVYLQSTARTAGVLYTAVGGAAQVSYAQPAVPTITVNGGTAPSCAGTDTAMTCTIGTAPPAAATFTVTFSGTWPTNGPACQAVRATAGATPLVQGVVTSTTTAQVNLSANLVASEKFHINCGGIS